MKTIASFALLLSLSGAALAQESVSYERLGSWTPRDTSSCDTIYGDGRQLCLADRYHMQQDQKTRDEQSSLRRVQEENQRLNNDLLRRELAHRTAVSATPASAADFAAMPEFAPWHGENRWFGADRARTEYAILYARDLHQEQPELAGRPFLNALSVRVKEVFAPAKH